MARIGSEQDLAQEFGGMLVPDNSRNDGLVLVSHFGCEEVREDDERLSAHDRLRRFVPIEAVPAIGHLAGQRWAQFIR